MNLHLLSNRILPDHAVPQTAPFHPAPGPPRTTPCHALPFPSPLHPPHPVPPRTAPTHPTVRDRSPHHRTSPRGRTVLFAGRDYTAAGTDDGVLQLPPRAELKLDQVQNVFGYRRNLTDKYEVMHIIGSGSFGTVYLGQNKHNQEYYAIKVIPKLPKNGVITSRYLLKIRNEVEVMQQLGASFDAVYLEDVYESDDAVHLVMELCNGGSLTDLMHNSKNLLNETKVAQIAHSITRFVSQCHTRGIIYRDIKPDNFLFQTKEPDSPLKATDFGLSIPYSKSNPPLRGRSGTPAYMAPEVILKKYNEQADVWSLGMLIYQLLTGSFPYMRDVNTAKLHVVWNSILNYNINIHDNPQCAHLSDLAKDFLSKLLVKNQQKRLTAAEALQHEWIRPGTPLSTTPFKETIIQRLQRFATYGYLKQMILNMIMNEIQNDQEAIGEACQSSWDEAALSSMSEDEVAVGDDNNNCISNQARLDLQEITQQFLRMQRVRGESGRGADSDGDDGGLMGLKGGGVLSDEEQGSGLSYDEWHDGLIRQGFTLQRGESAQLMSSLDMDNDGVVQYNELAAGLIDWKLIKKTEAKFSQWVDKVFDILDLNGDGFINLEEIMFKLKQQYNNKNNVIDDSQLLADAKQIMRQADSNGDGLISREEFSSLLEDVCNHNDTLEQYDTRINKSISDEDVP